jgi:hypothetical protein
MPELLIGPLLRFVSETDATIWVETSEQCEVEILGRREPTFRFEDHHYALVRLEGLDPDSTYEYEVALDGRQAWPALEGMPPSKISTLGGSDPLEIAFGSCRVALPHEPPFTDGAKIRERRGIGTPQARRSSTSRSTPGSTTRAGGSR